jgi:hypothetical protein
MGLGPNASALVFSSRSCFDRPITKTVTNPMRLAMMEEIPIVLAIPNQRKATNDSNHHDDEAKVLASRLSPAVRVNHELLKILPMLALAFGHFDDTFCGFRESGVVTCEDFWRRKWARETPRGSLNLLGTLTLDFFVASVHGWAVTHSRPGEDSA